MQLLIHAGAGNVSRDSDLGQLEPQMLEGLKAALETGYAILRAGGSSLDAVTEVVAATAQDNRARFTAKLDPLPNPLSNRWQQLKHVTGRSVRGVEHLVASKSGGIRPFRCDTVTVKHKNPIEGAGYGHSGVWRGRQVRDACAGGDSRHKAEQKQRTNPLSHQEITSST